MLNDKSVRRKECEITKFTMVVFGYVAGVFAVFFVMKFVLMLNLLSQMLQLMSRLRQYSQQKEIGGNDS